MAFCLAPLGVYAADQTCQSKDSVGNPLGTYLSNLHSSLGEIVSTASAEGSCRDPTTGNLSANLEQVLNRIVGDYNSVLYYPNYLTSVWFYIDAFIDVERPSYIMDDYTMLNTDRDAIDRAYRDVYETCGQSKVMIAGDFTGLSTVDALAKILQNHIAVTNFYREVVLQQKTDGDYTFILVGNDATFKSQMHATYGQKMQNACRHEGGTWDRISTAIENIGKKGGSISAGLDEWEDAWALLNNSDSSEYKQLEYQLLSDELFQQGISARGSDVILHNLDTYNGTNKAEGVTGFMRSVGQRIGSSFGELEVGLRQLKAAFFQEGTIQSHVQIDHMVSSYRNVNTEIMADYQLMKASIGRTNATDDETLALLISMQMGLHQINDTMKQTIPDAEKVCNDQDRGAGNCRFR